jgi:2-oxo-4-hydroxy-4-carboxy--5-ureidoimidazoline (OHCU) decarboxylase
VPLLVSFVRMRELPRQLSVEELAEALRRAHAAGRLLAEREQPARGRARRSAELSEADKLDALDAHPEIGRSAGLRSARPPSRGDDAEPVILTELAYLNQVYEEKFGFRFVVFVNGRPKTEILEVLRGRLERTREEELETGARRARRDRARPLEPRLVDPYANEWLSFLARWLHVMAGIVWIGTSFYFVALDNHLRDNESWEIHGGGFYRVEKFVPAPPRLPGRPALVQVGGYTTWLSGFALLVFLYYFNATTYLVLPGGPLGTGWSITVSVVLLGVAWLVYDGLCRVLRSELVLAVALLGLTTLAAWGSTGAVRAARRVPAGWRDARDDHGRERLLRDHPSAPRADPREGGLPRARPRPRRSRPSGARCTTTT